MHKHVQVPQPPLSVCKAPAATGVAPRFVPAAAVLPVTLAAFLKLCRVVLGDRRWVWFVLLGFQL